MTGSTLLFLAFVDFVRRTSNHTPASPGQVCSAVFQRSLQQSGSAALRLWVPVRSMSAAPARDRSGFTPDRLTRPALPQEHCKRTPARSANGVAMQERANPGMQRVQRSECFCKEKRKKKEGARGGGGCAQLHGHVLLRLSANVLLRLS